MKLAIPLALLVATSAAARPDDPGSDLFTFDVGDVVLTHDSTRFRFHYTVDGTHAIPVADVDVSGVPDHLEELAEIYEASLDLYVQLGYRTPLSDENQTDDGGDARFDVYLVDFNFQADGAYRREVCDEDVCTGYMVQENDFRGYRYPSVSVANRTVASHELFHAVQAAYDDDQGAVMAEGTAVWASERFDPSLFDLEGFSYGYLDDATTSLDSPSSGAVDPFSYGSAVFFLSLTERYGEDVLLHLWERAQHTGDDDPFWFDFIDDVLQEDAGVSFVEAFTEFASWTLFTGDRADPARGFSNGDALSERVPEQLDMPVDRPAFVVFTSSSRLVQVSRGDRARLRVALAGDPANFDGVTLFALPVDANAGPGELTTITDVAAGAVVDVGVDAELLVLLVNGRQQGQGARPTLCIGDEDEVAACTAVAEGEGEGEGEGDEDIRLSGGGCACAAGDDDDAAVPLIAFGIGLLASACLRLGPKRRQRSS
ncbi:MAG: hypothetical protein Q8O67_25095 [Deltaproteobacteria bacterium]|nr:hypothetical protein [Deltaproteobacteria bacterium]